MRNAFVDTIIEAVQTRDDVYIISGDAGLGVFDSFKEKHPDRFLNLGVAEQNTVSFAAGLAMTGFRVMIYNIIPFLLYRCYEQVRNDICYQGLPVILAGIGSGLTYSPQGMTHYSVEDIGIARTLPNLAIISPVDPVEARLAAQYALSSSTPVYVRLAKRGEPTLHGSSDFDICKPQMLRPGQRVALACHGSVAEEALQAAGELARHDINPAVMTIPMLHPMDQHAVAQMLSGFDLVLVIEEHYNFCGLGGMLASLIAEAGLPCRLTQLGVPHQFIHDIHDNQGMRKKFGFSVDGIVRRVLEKLEVA
jgi:transketolase